MQVVVVKLAQQQQEFQLAAELVIQVQRVHKLAVMVVKDLSAAAVAQ
jgi:hypothetical protein